MAVMPERAPVTMGEKLSYAIEALCRATLPPFGAERSLARARLGGEVASELLDGASPQAILARLVAQIEAVNEQVTE
jgi:hypothetical protein